MQLNSKLFLSFACLLLLSVNAALAASEEGYGTGPTPLDARTNAIDEARYLLQQDCPNGWSGSTVNVIISGRLMKPGPAEYYCRVRVTANCNPAPAPQDYGGHGH